MDAVLMRYWREKRTLRAKCQIGARSDAPRITFVILVLIFGAMSWKQLKPYQLSVSNSSAHLRTVLASLVTVAMVCAILLIFYSVFNNIAETRRKFTKQRHFEMNLLCISILATLSSLLGIICVVSGIIFHDNLKKFDVTICAGSYCDKHPLECLPTGKNANHTTTEGLQHIEQSCSASFVNYTPLCGAAIILCALSMVTDGHYYYKSRREVILLEATSHGTPRGHPNDHWPVRYRVAQPLF